MGMVGAEWANRTACGVGGERAKVVTGQGHTHYPQASEAWARRCGKGRPDRLVRGGSWPPSFLLVAIQVVVAWTFTVQLVEHDCICSDELLTWSGTTHRGVYGIGGGGGMYKSRIAGFSFLVVPLAEPQGDWALIKEELFWKKKTASSVKVKMFNTTHNKESVIAIQVMLVEYWWMNEFTVKSKFKTKKSLSLCYSWCFLRYRLNMKNRRSSPEVVRRLSASPRVETFMFEVRKDCKWNPK